VARLKKVLDDERLEVLAKLRRTARQPALRIPRSAATNCRC